MKICTSCGIAKPPEGNFYLVKSKSGQKVLRSYCIACEKLKAVAWQKKNPEKKKEADRKERLKPDRAADIRRIAMLPFEIPKAA
jgi:hypothetical protein